MSPVIEFHQKEKSPVIEAETRRVVFPLEDQNTGKGVLRKSKSLSDFHRLQLTDFIHCGEHGREQNLGNVQHEKIAHGVSRQKCSKQNSAKDVRTEIETGEELVKCANTVAFLTLNVMAGACYCFLELKEALTKKSYEILRTSAFCSIANAILTIFDTEDLKRIYDYEDLVRDYERFSSHLVPSYKVKNQMVKLPEFSLLREHDFMHILKDFQYDSNNFMDKPPCFSDQFWITDPCLPDIELAKTVIQDFVPLKRSDRAQLAMELLFRKNYQVYYMLVLRMVGSIKIDRSYSKYAVRSSADQDPHHELASSGVLSRFIAGIVSGLSWLTKHRSSELDRFRDAIIFPIDHAEVFGPCHKEVIEVIKFAEFGRRMQEVHFISVQHVVFSLSLSRVGMVVKRSFNKGQVKVLSSYFSVFDLYRRSRRAANHVGEKIITLDHLVMALFCDRCSTNSLREELERSTPGHEDDKVLFADAWDAKLLKRLSLGSCYTKSNVEKWISFSSKF